MNLENSLSLQLFAEDGGSESGVTEAVAQPQTEDPQQGQEDFEKLIKGPYKQAYDARVKSILQQRLKNSRETAEKYAAAQPLLTYMRQTLGVEGEDFGALEQALRAQLPGKPDPAEQQRQAAEIQAGADRMVADWQTRGDEIRKIYPEFDLTREMCDPRFRQLLRARVEMQTAYEILHKDEIIPAAMAYAAQRVEKQLAQKMRTEGLRPTENGTAGTGAVQLGNRVAQMSREEIAALCRRVERGEKVSFG